MLILPFNQAVRYHVLAGKKHLNFVGHGFDLPGFGQCQKLSRYFTIRASISKIFLNKEGKKN